MFPSQKEYGCGEGPVNVYKRKGYIIGVILFIMLLGSIAVTFVIMKPMFVAAQNPPAWGPDIRLTNVPGDSRRVAIAVGPDGYPSVSFDDVIAGYRQVYYIRLDQNGNVVVPMTRISFDAGDAQRSDIAVDANRNALIVWDERKSTAPYHSEIHAAKIGSNGQRLAYRAILPDGNTQFPAIDIDQRTGDMYVVFEQRQPYAEVFVRYAYLAKYDNNLNPVIQPQEIFPYTPGVSPNVAVGPDGIVHVVWILQGLYWSTGLYYQRFTTNGQPTGLRIGFVGPGVSVQEYSALKPKIAVDQGNNAHILFTTPMYVPPYPSPTDPKGGYVVYLKLRDGQRIVQPVRVYSPTSDDNDYGAEEAAFAVDDQGRAHVIVHNRWGSGNSRLLYYTVNTDGSITGPLDLGFPLYTAPEKLAVAAGQSGRLFAGWNDDREGRNNMEAFLKIKYS